MSGERAGCVLPVVWALSETRLHHRVSCHGHREVRGTLPLPPMPQPLPSLPTPLPIPLPSHPGCCGWQAYIVPTCRRWPTAVGNSPQPPRPYGLSLVAPLTSEHCTSPPWMGGARRRALGTTVCVTWPMGFQDYGVLLWEVPQSHLWVWPSLVSVQNGRVYLWRACSVARSPCSERLPSPEGDPPGALL